MYQHMGHRLGAKFLSLETRLEWLYLLMVRDFTLLSKPYPSSKLFLIVGCGAWLSLGFRGLVSAMFGFKFLMGVGGRGFPPPTKSIIGGSRVGKQYFMEPPLERFQGKFPRREFFWEHFLVKYCNFLANLNHFSLGYRYDGIICVRFFSPRMRLSFMYEGVV